MLHPVRFITAPVDYDQSRLVQHTKDYSSLVLVTDQNTEQLCKRHLDNTNVNYSHHLRLGALTEKEKNMETVTQIWDYLLENHIDRKAAVVVLGGGLLSDLTGYATSVYKRGLHLYLIPTTLLSMVDAALGGKNGINYQGLKNQMGTISPPREVLIDPDYLHTLPYGEIMSGTSEMLKHALIARPDYFDRIIHALDSGKYMAYLPELIRTSVQIKLRVTQSDPRERGLRKILNFGHTIGHALESCLHQQGTPLTHGHAVAVGMMMALELSAMLTGMDAEEAKYFIHALRTHYPVPALSAATMDCVVARMRHDKKNEGGQTRFVLLKAPGKPIWDVPVPVSVLNAVMDRYLISS